jgi:heme/copper-type cytochrome/quinol oxidase subunit 2
MTYSLTDIYNSELIACSWFGVSLVLLTSALLFYHMTRVSSLEMNSTVAGIFAIILMIISMGLCIMAVYTYHARISRSINKDNKDKDGFSQERKISPVITTFGIILAIVEIGICVTIIKGTIKRITNPIKK